MRQLLVLLSVGLAGCFSPGGTTSGSSSALCSSDQDCNAQKICVSGSCQPITGYPCLVNTDCRPPLTVCVSGSCQMGCQQDSDCSNGATCNTTNGMCIAPSSGGGTDGGTSSGGTCLSNSDCGGQICVAGTCVPCSGNSDCGLGSVCLAGACGSCSSTSQCDPGQVCVSGLCSNGCTSSSQCANGQVCDSTTSQCRACTSTADCGGSACVNGACQAPCTSNSQCNNGQICSAGICGPCSSASQCASGQICAGGACSPCSSNSQCNGQVCLNGACQACTSSGQCATGQVCSGGTCGACTSNSQCGTGQVCTNGTCQAGNTCPTWANQVSAFMNNYCTGCHGSMSSQSSVQNDSSRIQSSIDQGSMPPSSPYPTQAEITMMDQWFSSTCNMQ